MLPQDNESLEEMDKAIWSAVVPCINRAFARNLKTWPLSIKDNNVFLGLLEYSVKIMALLRLN